MRKSTWRFWHRLTFGFGIYAMTCGVGVSLILGVHPLGILFPIGATLYWLSDLIERQAKAAGVEIEEITND